MGERAAPPARLSGAVALLVSLAPLLAAGQQGRPPEQVRADLERLRSQISTLETQLAQIGEQRETLNDDFEAADIELVLGRQRLQVIRIRLSVLAEEAVERQRQVDRLSAELDDARQELAARIVALYRMGPLSYSRFLLAADSPEEVLANYQMVGRLAAQDRSLVTSIRISLERHREAVRLLSTSRARLATMRDEEGLAVANLGARQELRRELIRQLDIEAAYGRQALAEREDSAVALERLLGSVSASSTVAAPAAGEAGFATTRGELSWPAEGPVTETFGRKRHPVYDTYTLQKGIEIDAGAGAAVQAVYEGRVRYADWFQNYGLVVILDHGGDYFTIYGHLESIAVRPGDWVDPGGRLGTVGETGSLAGPSLYFEIREGTEALNPQSWLRRR
jgi:septal ring factor EnvC (AmiA/AmiB activator)